MQKRGHKNPAREWKPLVVCPDAKMGLQIRSALSGQGFDEVISLPSYPPSGELTGLLARHEANLCFLDVATNPEEALALVGEAASTVPVVAMNPLNDADLILRCLRRGACEFLSAATVEQVGAVLERLSRLHAPVAPQKTAKAYCVVPGKAGCGASTVAAYLAMELKRGGASRVLLVDTDWITASVSFFFKLKSDFHLGDALRDRHRMDDDLWSRLTVPYQGVDILLAPQNPTIPLEVDHQAATELLSFWRKHYEAVVMDLAGASSNAIAFAAVCDEVLLVTTNELAALHSTKRTMEYLEKVADPTHLRLLVTRYTPSTGLKREDVQTALKLEPWVLLSNDYEGVQAALLEGKPVAPGSYFGRSIRALAERLQGKKEEAPKKRSTLFGLLPQRS